MSSPFDSTSSHDASRAAWQARALPAGARVRWIEIVGVIAETRSSIVYRATDHASDADIVLKEYMPLRLAGRQQQAVLARGTDEADAFARGLQAFLAEGQMLAQVEHPSLVRVIDLVEANGTAYHVMPYRDGTPLLQLRQQMAEPPSDDALRALIDRLLGALQVLHEAGAVHGGVSPRKILMLENDRPLLLGPDLAAAQTASDLVESLMANVEPSFAAPEQRQAAPADAIGPWTDLYGLAATLRFCLGGEMPLPASEVIADKLGETSAQMLQRLLGEQAAKAYSISLLDALDAALDPQPTRRPRDVAAFRAALSKRPQLKPLDVPLQAASAPVPAPAPAPAPAVPVKPVAPPIVNDAAAVDAPRRTRVEPAFDPHLISTAAPAVPAAPPRSVPAPPRAAEPPAAAAPARAAPPPPKREPAAMAFTAGPAAPTVQQRVAAATRRRSHGEFWAGAALASLIAVGMFTWWRNNQPVEFELPTQPTGGATVPATRDLPATTGAPPVTVAEPAPVVPTTITPAPVTTPADPLPVNPPSARTTLPDPVAPAPVVTAAPTPAPTPTPTPAPAPVAAAPTPAPATPPANSSARVVKEAARTSPATVAAAPKAASPRAACGERTPFALYRCMQSLCAQAGWSRHAQCDRLRKTDSVD